MKTKYKVSVEFIKEAHKSACDTWKKKIEKEFPKIFEKPVFEVGKWYRVKTGGSGAFCADGVLGIAIQSPDKEPKNHSGELFGKTDIWIKSVDGFIYALNQREFKVVLLTEDEVKEALIKEAESRGYKHGTKIVSYVYGISSLNRNGSTRIEGSCFSYMGCILMKDGVWAEIIKETEVTQSELEVFYKEQKGIDNLKVVP